MLRLLKILIKIPKALFKNLKQKADRFIQITSKEIAGIKICIKI